MKRALSIAAICGLMWPGVAAQQWPHYAGDQAASHYSPLEQITSGECAAPLDRMGMEAERKGAAAVRHAPRGVPEHAAHDRRRALPQHALQPGRRARCGHAARNCGATIRRPTRTGSRPTARASRIAASPPGGPSTSPGRRRAAHLPERALQLIQLDAKTGTPVDVVRHERRRRSQRRPGLGDQQEALHEHLAADRLQGPRHPRQRRRRSAHLQERSAGRRARVQRAHRQAGLEVPHHPAARRVRQQHVGRRLVAVHRPHQRLGADEPRRTSAACSTCRSARRATTTTAAAGPAQNLFAESLVCLDADDRQAQVALPDRASRAVGLRPGVAAEPRHHHASTASASTPSCS